MDRWQQFVQKDAVSTAALEVIVVPVNITGRPNFHLCVENVNEANAAALADASVEFGPTEAGPWVAEDLTASGIKTLAVGAAKAVVFTRYQRFARFQAKSAATGGQHTKLKVWVDACPTE